MYMQSLKYRFMVDIKYCLIFFIFRRLVMENSYAPDSYIDSVSNRYFLYSLHVHLCMNNLCLHVFTIR